MAWPGAASHPFSEIRAVELRPLNALTRGSIRLRVPGVAPKQVAADELAVLNRAMPLRFGPVNEELSAFAERIERRLGRPGVDLRKDV